MARMLPITIDFETKKIAPRPEYPPKPVGVAIHEPGKRPEYLAFAHPTENNCTQAQAGDKLRGLYKSGRPLLFHNAKFDLDVAEEHFGLRPPPWHLIDDTMLLAFLHDPHSNTVALKTLAERELKLPPAERDELRDWIIINVPEARRSKSQWGAYISQAPGQLVGRYAIGDVVRTRQLWEHYRDLVLVDDGMRKAYDRERKLLPYLLRMERAGVPVNARKLRRDVKEWERALINTDAWLRKRLKSPELDVDSNDELADALERGGCVTDWVLTEKGARSTAKDALEEACTDAEVVNVLRYRGRLTNGMRNFGKPWLEVAEKSNGLIYTSWNQVRQAGHGKGGIGARTGRLSSSPNFQNVPKLPELIAHSAVEAKKLKPEADKLEVKILTLPKALNGMLTPLPNLRDYIVATKGHRLNNRDYSQQELRLLGHFEDAVLLQSYQDDPWLDVHDLAQRLINGMLGTNFTRRPIKNTGFGLIYGMGVGKLAATIDSDVQTAKRLREAYLRIFPGLKALDRELKRRASRDEPIRTWGGRLYYVEPPKVIDGRLRRFDYKLLNQLIQGSAADVTKEAMIRYYEARGDDARMLLTVHDELMTLAEVSDADEDMRVLRETMESIECDVQMLSDGKTSTTSWARAKPYDDKREEAA